MKKLLSVLLALVMTLTAAAPALAAEAPPMAEDMPQTGALAPAAEAPAADTAQEREVPLTFHGWSESAVLRCDFIAADEEVTLLEDGSLQDTVLAGADISVVMAAGYGLEVLAGGSVTGSHVPDDPAFPDGTEYDVHVNEDAEIVELAAVCTGESAEVLPEDTPSTEELAPEEAEPLVEETVPEEEPPEEEAMPEAAPEAQEAAPEMDAPEAAAAQSVTVSILGAVEQIEDIYYDAPDGSQCGYNEIYGGTGMDQVKVVDGFYQTIGQVDAIPGTLAVMPGSTVRFYLDANYDLAVENGSVTDNYVHATPVSDGEIVSFRGVDVTAPADGVLTVTVTGSDQPAPETIPYTFYNYKWYGYEDGGIVGGGSVIDGPEAGKQYAFSGDGWITTGGSFEVWTAPGYEIQVLEGGSIVEQRAPSGPAAASVPAGSICFVLRVDVDASQFVIACVKQGETFTLPQETAAEHPATGTFKDVPDDSWYKDVVEKAYASGMISGTSADTFSPNAVASRGQTVAMLYREAGCPDVDVPVTFGDLTADYYKDAVKWAAAIGAVQGVSETQFAPDRAVTRQQLAAMLYRMAGQPGVWAGGMMEDYTDAQSIAEYARGPMQWALDNGIIKGYGDRTIRPNTTATRAEVCAMLVRYNEVIALYPDDPVWWAGAGGNSGSGEESLMQAAPAIQTGVNYNNSKLIAPKRTKIDDGIYDIPETRDQFFQQWSETFWGLDRSGEDVMWCLRNLTRVRSGPGDDYPVVATLYATYEVSRLGPDENGWTPVVYHEYKGGAGFTGWDYTGYVHTDKISSVRPCHTHVADFSSGPALKAWCDQGGVPEGDMYYDCGATANGTFYHEAYTPVISGDTYTYTLRGGGKVTIHNVLPEGLVSVEASGEEELHNVLLFIYLRKDYGVVTDEGYGGGYSLSPSGDYQDCEICWEGEISNDENIDFAMFSGDEAPHLVQVTVKDSVGGSYMGNGASRFVWVDKNGNCTSDFGGENFITLRSGFKLKSASPYVSIGTVSYESNFFYLNNVPRDVDQVYVEVIRK